MTVCQFYTYFHTRNDTGAVFYVGKGKGRRAHDTTRNKYWRSIYEKCGRTVNFAMTNLSEAEAFEHEKYLIAHYKSMGVSLANFTNGGEGVSGLVFTEEHRAAIALKSTGRKHSEEYKQLMREKMVGRIMSDETRRKMSESAKVRKEREGNVFFGSNVTDEQRAEWIEKSAKSQSGKKLSEDHKAKISAAGKGRVSANKGKTLSKEWREKMSAASKGRSKSDEHKAKIKAAHIARIERLKGENLQ
jgi:NUMOD3 motif